MLPKQNRLTKKKDFENVFKNGRGTKAGFLFLKFASNKLNYTRFAFIVSLKVSKKAVQRNKIRRCLSEVIRLRISQIQEGFDCVLVVSPGFQIEEADNTLNLLLKQSKLLIQAKLND